MSAGPGDPGNKSYLGALSRTSHRSPGQQEAAHTALCWGLRAALPGLSAGFLPFQCPRKAAVPEGRSVPHRCVRRHGRVGRGGQDPPLGTETHGWAQSSKRLLEPRPGRGCCRLLVAPTAPPRQELRPSARLPSNPSHQAQQFFPALCTKQRPCDAGSAAFTPRGFSASAPPARPAAPGPSCPPCGRSSRGRTTPRSAALTGSGTAGINNRKSWKINTRNGELESGLDKNL